MTSHSDSLNSKTTVSHAVAPRTWSIAVLPGDGIGPEVVAEGVKVLREVTAKFPGLPYIVFPGNVGDADALKNLVAKLNLNETAGQQSFRRSP